MVEAVTATCPKCGAPRGEELACPKCGLRTDRVAALAAERDAAVPPAVHAAWVHVQSAWDEPAAHDALFALTAQHACFAWTAARYRELRTAKGAANTDHHLERVRKAAEATLLATATARPDTGKRPYRTSATVLVIAVVMIVVGLMFAMAQRGRPALAPRGHVPTSQPTTAAPSTPQPVPPAPQVR